MMGGDIVRSLIAGAALLLLVAVPGAVGGFDPSALAVGGVFLTLLLLFSLALFDDGWEAADQPGDGVVQVDPLTLDPAPVVHRIERRSTAA